jgi:hypothetical protein
LYGLFLWGGRILFLGARGLDEDLAAAQQDDAVVVQLCK